MVEIPTMYFQWCIKHVPAPHLGIDLYEKRPVLQQKFIDEMGQEFWKDVPTVTGTD